MMRKTAPLLGVVAFARSFLFAIARQHRRVQIQVAFSNTCPAQHLRREITRSFTPRFALGLGIKLVPEPRQRSGSLGETFYLKCLLEDLHPVTPPLHMAKAFPAREDRQ